MRNILILVTIAAGVVGAPAAHADDDAPPRVGVVIELAVSVEPARADAIGLALADALNRELVVDAFGGGDVSRRLPPEGLGEECLARPACVGDVAARLDADQLLFLVVVQVGDDVQVDASWVDVATGAVSSRPRVVLPSDAQAVSEFAAAAPRLLPDAKERRAETVIVTGGGGPVVPVRPAVPRHMTTPAWIAAGTGGAALIAGAALGLSARSTYQACEPEGTCSDARLDGIETRARLADVSFVIAAGAAITTAILYVSSGEPAEPARGALGVAPVRGGAVVGIGGRF